MIVEQTKDIEVLRRLGNEWIAELHNDRFGLLVDIDTVANELQGWLDVAEGTILVAKADEESEPVALFVLFALDSFMGKQKVAFEKYWYAKHDGLMAGPKLYIEAVQWAREHGCSHIITSGSMLMPERHDSICSFLEKTGAQHYETSYIYKL